MVDDRGAPASGTVSLIDRATGATRHVDVGIHPTAIVVRRRPRLRRQRHERLDQRDRPRGRQGHADDPAALGVAARARRHAQRPGPARRRRSTSPTAATTPWPRSTSPQGRVRGFRHAGYFPTAVAPVARRQDGLRAQHQGQRLGEPDDCSASRATPTTSRARSPSSTSSADLARETELVARNNRWEANPGRPPLKVYNGGDQARPLHHQGEPHLRRGLRRPAAGQRRPEAVQPGRDGHAQPPQDRPRVHPVRQRLRQRDQQRRRARLVDPVPGQRLPRALLRRLLADLSRRRRLRHVDLERRRPLGRRAQEGADRSASGASSATTSSRPTTRSPRTGSRSGRTGSRGRTGSSSPPTPPSPASSR